MIILKIGSLHYITFCRVIHSIHVYSGTVVTPLCVSRDIFIRIVETTFLSFLTYFSTNLLFLNYYLAIQ